MKLTKEMLKQIIKEELQATLNEMEGDKVSLVRSLNDAMYSLDQGYDEEEITAAKETVERVKKQMSPGEFKIADKIAGLYVSLVEYAGPNDAAEIEAELKELCSQLGITLGDIM